MPYLNSGQMHESHPDLGLPPCKRMSKLNRYYRFILFKNAIVDIAQISIVSCEKQLIAWASAHSSLGQQKVPIHWRSSSWFREKIPALIWTRRRQIVDDNDSFVAHWNKRGSKLLFHTLEHNKTKSSDQFYLDEPTFGPTEKMFPSVGSGKLKKVTRKQDNSKLNSKTRQFTVRLDYILDKPKRRCMGT